MGTTLLAGGRINQWPLISVFAFVVRLGGLAACRGRTRRVEAHIPI